MLPAAFDLRGHQVRRQERRHTPTDSDDTENLLLLGKRLDDGVLHWCGSFFSHLTARLLAPEHRPLCHPTTFGADVPLFGFLFHLQRRERLQDHLGL